MKWSVGLTAAAAEFICSLGFEIRDLVDGPRADFLLLLAAGGCHLLAT